MAHRPRFAPYKSRPAHLPSVLEGVRVLEFTKVLAGPVCSQMLADFGAEVIKIEPPVTGDDVRFMPPFVDDNPLVSTFFTSCNRNKRTLALDLNSERGREIVMQLVAKADIIVENYTTRVMKKFGLDFEALSEKFPRLIYLSISAYGRTGEMANAGGFDPVLGAECGLAALNGNPEDEPSSSTVPWVDMTAAMNGAIGVLGALYARNRLGKGQHVDIAMYDTGIADLTYIGASYLGTGEEPARLGRLRPTSPPSGQYKCSDGKAIYFYTINDPSYRRLCLDVLDRPDLAEDPRFKTAPARRDHIGEIVDIMTEIILQDSSESWYRMMLAANIAVGVMRSPSEALCSPLAAERNMCTEIPHSQVGSVFNIGSPFQRMSLTPAVDPIAARLLGEDSRAILSEEIGLDEAEIGALIEAGAIGVPDPEQTLARARNAAS